MNWKLKVVWGLLACLLFVDICGSLVYNTKTDGTGILIEEEPVPLSYGKGSSWGEFLDWLWGGGKNHNTETTSAETEPETDAEVDTEPVPEAPSEEASSPDQEEGSEQIPGDTEATDMETLESESVAETESVEAGQGTESVMDVRDFGAVGDGRTDDTQALKAAIEAGAGKEVYIPSGTYMISSKIYIPESTRIVGDGESTVLMAAPGMARGMDLLKIYQASGIQIEQISFSGNSGVNKRGNVYNTQDGIHLLDIWYATDVTISNCSFRDNIYAAIRCVGSSNVSVFESAFQDVDCGLITLGSDDISDITVHGCTFDGHEKSEPVSFFATAKHSNITITDNVMSNKRDGSGVLFSSRGSHENILVTGNQISGTATGISADHVTSGIISGNVIGDTTGGYGIVLTDCADIRVEDNSMSRVMLDGIRLTSCRDVVVSGNLVNSAGLKNKDFLGIRIKGACENLVLQHNQVAKGTAKSGVGIYVEATGTIQVMDSLLEDCVVSVSRVSDKTTVQ